MGHSPRVPSLVQPGERIAHYEILDELGRGGMGVVYRARDLTLGRRVALKCALTTGEAGDARHRKRLLREARAVSRLSHPHIVPIFEVVEHQGVSWLAMGLVEGTSLRGLLASGPLPIADVVRYAEGLSGALEAAHARRILHRDISPNNIMVTKDNTAVLMDFGLARILQASDNSSTQSRDSDLDGHDRVVGTLRYMSPEQALAKPLDVRSDLFSLGAVIYEMCTGQTAFPGDGAQVLDALLHRHPVAISRLNYDAPEELDRIVRKLLAKNPDDRYQSARDLIVDLRSLRRGIEQTEYAELSPAPAAAVGKWARPALRRHGLWILLTVAGIAAAVTLWRAWPARNLPVRPSPYLPMVLSIEPPPGTRFSEGSLNTAAISPDGQYVAFVATDSAGNTQLWLRPLRSPQAQAVADSRGAGSPFWSPDSRAIAFFGESGLRRVNLGGGRSEMMAPATEDRGGSWGASGVVLVALDPRRGLFQIPATGGRLQQVIEPDPSRGEVGYMWPQFLHDGRRFLYFVLSNDERVRGIYLGSLDGGRGRRLVGSDTSAVSTAGRLLLVRDGTLVAQRFDESTEQLEGQSTALLENVATSLTYRSAVSVSEVDSLVYSSGQATDVTQIGWYDRSGNRVATIDAPAKYRDPALSRDGRYLAVEHYRDSISDIRVFDLIRGGMIRLAPSVEVRFPVWSPDGRLAYSSSDRGWRDIYVRRMEGTGEPMLLVQSPSDKMPTDWSSDGRFLVYTDLPPGGSYDLWVLPVEEGGKPAPILRGPAQEVSGKFSPDVKWLAYVSTESGQPEVYVRRFPAGEMARRASVGGGYDPVWLSPKRLSFLDRGGQLMEVAVPASELEIIGRPQPVMRTKVLTPGTSRNHYQWSADGKRVLVNSPAFDVPSGGMNVIVSWSSMLAK